MWNTNANIAEKNIGDFTNYYAVEYGEFEYQAGSTLREQGSAAMKKF